MATVMAVALFGTLVLLFIGYGLMLHDLLSSIRPEDKKLAIPLRYIVSLVVVATLMLLVAVCFAVLVGLTVSRDPATLWQAFRM